MVNDRSRAGVCVLLHSSSIHRDFFPHRVAAEAQDWIHLIAWDLIGGRWIYLDGLGKKVPTWHSLMITFGGGPLGLLVHFVTCSLSQKQQH
ncbi:hypothetical protein WJX79_005672 [Trebouxia sp. C0005]